MTGSSAVLDASASGPSTVTGVNFVVSGGSLSNQVVGTTVETFFSWIALCDTTGVPNGTYTLQSVVTEVGASTATSPAISVTVRD